MKQKIIKDFVEARKSKNQDLLKVLTMLKSAIDSLEKEKKSELSDSEIVSIVRKQIKLRDDALGFYPENSENFKQESEEKKILENYLPSEMSSEELHKLIDDVINNSPPEFLKKFGEIIKIVKEKTGGSVDGKTISILVKQKIDNLPKNV